MTDGARIGTTLAGKYRIIGPPVRTALGACHPAVDLRSDCAVEVRILPAPGATRPLQRAAHLAVGVRAPGLSAVYAAEVLPDGAAAVVCDPPGGVPLDAWTSGATAEAVVALLYETVRLLAYAHRHGLVHGALSPETVRVGAGNRPQLAELGLLALLSAWHGGLRGAHPAAEFAAPATAPTDPRTDVYGLARTFLAVGLLPEHLVSVLSRAASSDPALRYADAVDLAAALGLPLAEVPAPHGRLGGDTASRGAALLLGFDLPPPTDEEAPTVRVARMARTRLGAGGLGIGGIDEDASEDGTGEDTGGAGGLGTFGREPPVGEGPTQVDGAPGKRALALRLRQSAVIAALAEASGPTGDASADPAASPNTAPARSGPGLRAAEPASRAGEPSGRGGEASGGAVAAPSARAADIETERHPRPARRDDTTRATLRLPPGSALDPNMAGFARADRRQWLAVLALGAAALAGVLWWVFT